MKKIAIGCMALALMATSCNKNGMGEPQKPETFMDTVATVLGESEGMGFLNFIQNAPEEDKAKMDKDAIIAGMKLVLLADTTESFQQGMQMGMRYASMFQQMRAAGMDVNSDMFLANLAKALKADSVSQQQLDQIMPKAQAIMGQVSERMQAHMMAEQQKTQAAMQEKFEKNVKAGQDYIAKIKSEDPEIKTTESGLSYKIEKQGTGAVAKDGDKVSVIYTGKLIDGTEFDSSNGEKVEFPTDAVIPGFKEALTKSPQEPNSNSTFRRNSLTARTELRTSSRARHWCSIWKSFDFPPVKRF